MRLRKAVGFSSSALLCSSWYCPSTALLLSLYRHDSAATRLHSPASLSPSEFGLPTSSSVLLSLPPSRSMSCRAPSPGHQRQLPPPPRAPGAPGGPLSYESHGWGRSEAGRDGVVCRIRWWGGWEGRWESTRPRELIEMGQVLACGGSDGIHEGSVLAAPLFADRCRSRYGWQG